MADILVFAEVDDGVIHDISLQALKLARGLADASGGTVSAFTAGSGVSEAASKLFAYGADQVGAADDEQLKGYVADRYCGIGCTAIKGHQPALVLFPSSTVGNDLAATVAACLGTAVALDCDAVEEKDGGWTASRTEFDRKASTHFKAEASPLICSLRDGAAEMPEADESKSGDVQPIAVELDEAALASTVLKRDVAKKTVNLKEAKIIVSGGAGVGTQENFELIRQLADALGGEVGATRAVVDAGWLPADHQIGQTGATVRPDVYIACGISGAVQHRVGMMDSRKIVAINTDANAPIFRFAHYKMVGDLKDVVPKLIKLVSA